LDEIKGDGVVMALIDVEKIIVLMVCGHDVFFKDIPSIEAIELEKRIVHYHFSQGNFLKALREGNVTTDDEGHSGNLIVSKAGLVISPTIDGYIIIFPAMSASGHSENSRNQCNKIIKFLYEFDPQLETEAFIDLLYKGNRLEKPSNPNFEWRPLCGEKLNVGREIFFDGLGLYETTTQHFILLVPPSNGFDALQTETLVHA
jgi:hypothetical protein